MKPKAAAAKAGKVIKIILFIVILAWLLESYAIYGLIGFGIFCILWALLAIAFKWKQFVLAKQYVESMIWGKPLRFFTKEELRNTKVKLKWGKKKTSG